MYDTPKSAHPANTHVCGEHYNATSLIVVLLGRHPPPQPNQQMRPLPRTSLEPDGYELFATAGNE
jgi:hypothetical protein